MNDALWALSDTNASFRASLVGCRGGVVSGYEWLLVRWLRGLLVARGFR